MTDLIEAASGDQQTSATLGSPALVRQQRNAATVTILLPTAATALAVWLAVRHGLPLWALWLWLGMHLFTMLGITVGYHRQLSHRAFKAKTGARALLMLMGSMSAQGPIVHWVSNHRRHHEHSDQPDDTHSPHRFRGQRFAWLRGMWHAHIHWMFTSRVTNPMRYARDLLRDPLAMFMNRWYPLWVLLGIAIPGLIGWLIAREPSGFWLGALWGGLVRIFTVHHATWAINSITHWYGSRPYETREHSTNNLWLVLPSAGEAWHNCHHAFPASARFGLEWWQVDPGYILITVFRWLGWVWDVNQPSTATKAAKRARLAPQQP